MDEGQAEQRRQEEALKLCFDGCKHMATLSTAAAGVIVAIYREATLDSATLVTGLVAFGVSIIVSSFGLLVPISLFDSGGDRSLPTAFLSVSILMFLGGIGQVMANALGLPDWLALGIGVILGAAVVLVISTPILQRVREK